MSHKCYVCHASITCTPYSGFAHGTTANGDILVCCSCNADTPSTALVTEMASVGPGNWGTSWPAFLGPTSDDNDSFLLELPSGFELRSGLEYALMSAEEYADDHYFEKDVTPHVRWEMSRFEDGYDPERPLLVVWDEEAV